MKNNKSLARKRKFPEIYLPNYQKRKSLKNKKDMRNQPINYSRPCEKCVKFKYIQNTKNSRIIKYVSTLT